VLCTAEGASLKPRIARLSFCRGIFTALIVYFLCAHLPVCLLYTIFIYIVSAGEKEAAALHLFLEE